MSDHTHSLALTGLSYADWEQDTDLLAERASRSSRTGFLDANHLARANQVEAALQDELVVVDDVCALSDEETNRELRNIRAKLSHLRERILAAKASMLHLVSGGRRTGIGGA